MITPEKLILIAASGLASEVLGIVELMPTREVVGIIDDDLRRKGAKLYGVEILGPVEVAACYTNVKFVVCAGSGGAREIIVKKMESVGIGSDRFATIMHPTVSLSNSCSVDVGSIVLANVAMTANVTVGRHAVVMPNVVLTHDDRVDDYATLCASSVLGGSVKVGRRAYLGMGSSVRENLTIGEDAVLGMGAVAIQDIPAGETWVGLPARRISSKDGMGGPIAC